MTQTVYVHSLNLTRRLATTDNDQVGHIRTLIDDSGFETQSMDDAIVVTIEWENNIGWSWVRLSDYDEGSVVN